MLYKRQEAAKIETNEMLGCNSMIVDVCLAQIPSLLCMPKNFHSPGKLHLDRFFVVFVLVILLSNPLKHMDGESITHKELAGAPDNRDKYVSELSLVDTRILRKLITVPQKLEN